MTRESPMLRQAPRRPGSIITVGGRYLRVADDGGHVPFTPSPHPALSGRQMHCVGAGERSHHVDEGRGL